ncbi:MAG: hypothetical protein Q9225_003950 [Loekoesia sp. 1 TL-2023]
MAAAIVTLVELSRIGGSRDITYDYIPVNTWGIVQTYLAIVIASVPFLRPLFRDTKAPKAFSWTFYNSILRRHTRKSDSSDVARDDKENYTQPSGEQSRSRLPHIRRDRFVTTTLKNMGVEEDLMEKGEKAKDSEIAPTSSTTSTTIAAIPSSESGDYTSQDSSPPQWQLHELPIQRP